jgi:hypothetical protein
MDIRFRNYFLGVLAGDGELVTLTTKSGGTRPYELRWTSADEDWFSIVTKLIGYGITSTYKVKERNHKVTWLWRSSNQELLNWVISRGLQPRKSFKNESLIVPEDGYFFDFCRGLLDSDGNVVDIEDHKVHEGYIGHRLWCTIFAREAQIKWLKNELGKRKICSKLYSADCKLTKTPGLKKLTIYKSQSLRNFVNGIYPCNYCLERKRDRLVKVLTLKKFSVTPDELVEWTKFDPFFKRQVYADYMSLPVKDFLPKYGFKSKNPRLGKTLLKGIGIELTEGRQNRQRVQNLLEAYLEENSQNNRG